VHPTQVTGSPIQTPTITGTLEVESAAAVTWLDSLLEYPPLTLTATEFVAAAVWRSELTLWVPTAKPRPQLSNRGRQLLVMACQLTGLSHTERFRANPARHKLHVPSAARLAKEFWDALFDPTNLPGTAASAVQLVHAWLESLPLMWRIKLQGGEIELFDANKLARKHAFAARGKRRFPVKMMLRLKGARLNWHPEGFVVRKTGELRMPAPGAKTMSEALQITRSGRIKLISNVAFSRLPLPRVLGSTGVGLALTMGPQAIADAYSAGLFSDVTSRDNWNKFAIAAAKSQSANIAGMAAGGATVGAAVFVATWAGVAVPAVVVIALGIGFGALGQAGFNAVGASDMFEERARSLLK